MSLARRSPRVFALLALLFVAVSCDSTPAKTDSTAAPAAAATTPVAAPAAAPSASRRAPDVYRVAFETSRGPFVVEVTRAWAPLGADRFYELVTSGYFTDLRFFRVVPGFIAQFGMHADPKVNTEWREKRINDEPVVRGNTRGTIVFAKQSLPNTRSNQFFINLGDNSGGLDPQGFSAFGRVVGDGMKVVDGIYAGYGEGPDQEKIGNEGNKYLKKDFPKLDYIKSAKVVEVPKA